MITLNPIAITATAQQYAVNVTENLCQAFCLNANIQPQANVNFSVGEINVVNGTAFVKVNATGNISYIPKGSNCTKTKLFNEEFTVAFVGAGTPTISLTSNAQTQSAENVKCCNRAYAWNITTNLTITATFPTT